MCPIAVVIRNMKRKYRNDNFSAIFTQYYIGGDGDDYENLLLTRRVMTSLREKNEDFEFKREFGLQYVHV